MGYNRRGPARAALALLFGILAIAVTVGLFTATPAKAQTYPITQPATGGTTTTVAPTTTTKPVVKAGGLAFTGADITVTMGVAAAALGAGGVLVLVSRRRKAAQ
jgi:hypothetical protein